MMDSDNINRLFQKSLERRNNLSFSQKIFNVVGILVMFFLVNWGLAWFAELKMEGISREQYVDLINSNNSVTIAKWEENENKKFVGGIVKKIVGENTYLKLAQNKKLTIAAFLVFCYAIIFIIARIKGYSTKYFFRTIINTIFSKKGIIVMILLFLTIPLNNYIERIAVSNPDTTLANLDIQRYVLIGYLVLVIVVPLFLMGFSDFFTKDKFKSNTSRITVLVITVIILFSTQFYKEDISKNIAPKGWDMIQSYINFFKDLGLL